MKRAIAATVAAAAVVGGVVGGVAVAAGDDVTADCTDQPVVENTQAGQKITVECTIPNPAQATATVTVPGPTVTVTANPTDDPTTDPSASETTEPTDDPDPTEPTQPPTSPPTSPPAGDRPGPGNTGVPDGTNLTAYTGSCRITAANTVIDAKILTCSTLSIEAANVTIRNSLVKGRILVDTDVNRSWSLTFTDSEVDASDSGDVSAIANGNVRIVRANLHGGHNGLECQEHSSYCEIRDSWIHDQWQSASGDTHLGGLLHLGTVVPCTGTNGACAEIVHNTIVCDAPVNRDGGGCTGDINLLPHWGPLKGAIVTDNYLGANSGASYCTYGGAGMEYPATGVIYRNNVFERGTNRKCANYGPVTNFSTSAAGNVWQNNRYDDGTPINPAG